MFVVPPVAILLVFIIGRPFDLFESLRGLPLLNLLCGLGILGYAMDLKLRLSEFRASPQLGWVVAFMLWCIVTVIVRAPQNLVPALTKLAIELITFLLIAHGIRTFKGLQLLMGTVLLCATWVALLDTQLGLQDPQCVSFPHGDGLGTASGGGCEMSFECGGGDDAIEHRCERLGWFNLTTVARRVRYIGILQDPNEVAMLVAVSLPFAFAFYQRKPGKQRLMLLVIPMILFFITIRFSQSRGGLLVLLTVLGSYSLQRFGLKRVLLFGLPFVPVVLFLASAGERVDADASKYKRLGCMLAGVHMLFEWPVLGAGFGRFTQHHPQTAHNSYLLAAGELGVPGLLLWTTILYLSTKMALLAVQRCRSDESRVARTWGIALATSMVGLVIGNNFLSLTYHSVMWVFFALCGSFYAAVKAHDRNWKVQLSWRDGLLIVLGNVVIVFGVLIYSEIVL